jgi:hypothetical protein
MRIIEPQVFAEVTRFASSGQDSNKMRILIGSEATYAMKALLDSDEELASNVGAPGVLWILSMAAVRGAFTLLWLGVSWGAFRKILGMSWLRAVFSLAIFLCFGLIAALVLIFFQMAPVVVDPNRWLHKLAFLGWFQLTA